MGRAIARVAPLILASGGFSLRAYVKATGDLALAHASPNSSRNSINSRPLPDCSIQMFPTLLVPDGSFMIDRMGVYGLPSGNSSFVLCSFASSERVTVERRERHTSSSERSLEYIAYHVRNYYWLDLDGLNKIYRVGGWVCVRQQ